MKSVVVVVGLVLAGCAVRPPPPQIACPKINAIDPRPLTVEIYATGLYPQAFGLLKKVTAHDLDQMVYNFERLKQWVKPPLKFGHGPQQVIGGVHGNQGDPALGWLNHLERRDNKLVATIVDYPEIVRELIERKRYRRVSIEYMQEWENTTDEYNLKSGVKGYVVVGLALLGADIPRVLTLQDLATYLSEPRFHAEQVQRASN